MKQCKKCKRIKFNWQFKNRYSWSYEETWLCRKCAREIAKEKEDEYLKKYLTS